MSSAGNQIGSPFIELETIDSTNNYAMGLVHEGVALHGTTVFAHEQYSGRGQRNKNWISGKSQNIIVSIIIDTSGFIPSESFLLSMAMALGTVTFYKKYSGEDTKIKWPNDIFWGDRKAGGILIETIVQANDLKNAIVGIGLNVNQTDFGFLKNAISLKQITGESYDVIAMTHELCYQLQNSFEELKSDRESISGKYHKHLYKLNEAVKLKQQNRVFKGIVKGVSTAGELIITHGVEQSFAVGEVEWIY